MKRVKCPCCKRSVNTRGAAAVKRFKRRNKARRRKNPRLRLGPTRTLRERLAFLLPKSRSAS